ncbi:unnamed protein product [Nesidiocoris tenuis]|uniref:Uncharacterized protein n=1 Tax=Nesidiocoris tenuis TaxID=355587 RepID=A0A6H5H7K6_9HEMI|nr:unnamed protein product [Nesidiocoris tenuis]
MRVTIGSALLMGLLNFAVGGVPHNRPNRSAVESPEEFRWLEGSVATAYHFPWSCILYFQMRTSFKTPTSDLRDDYMFGSSCTIFSDRWVIVSLEALNTIHWGLRLFPVFSQRERVKKGAIVIQAGAQHAIFYTNENRKQLDPDSDSQQVGAEDLYVLLEPSLVAYLPTLRETFDEIVSTKQYIAKNPRNITYGTNKTVFDVKAFGMSSAFVKTNFSFDWTPYVQPMRISDPALIRLEQTTYKIRRLLRPDQFWRYLRARLGQRPLLQMVPVVCPCYCQVQYQLRFRRHAKCIHVDAGHCPILVFIERSSRRRNSLGKTGCLEVLHRIQPWRCELSICTSGRAWRMRIKTYAVTKDVIPYLRMPFFMDIFFNWRKTTPVRHLGSSHKDPMLETVLRYYVIISDLMERVGSSEFGALASQAGEVRMQIELIPHTRGVCRQGPFFSLCTKRRVPDRVGERAACASFQRVTTIIDIYSPYHETDRHGEPSEQTVWTDRFFGNVSMLIH